ncbi:MAG: hypothetical protein RL154_1202, partial [Pseudomonadota bacterium]
KTDESQIGRMIAGLNFVQSTAMLAALIITSLLAYFGVNGQEIFWICTVLLFVTAFFVSKEPVKDFARFFVSTLISIRYKIKQKGSTLDCDSVLLLGNHASWIDWAILQCVYPRRINFVMDDELFAKKHWNGILKYFGVIPISLKPTKGTILEIRELLASGKVVCIFPEGELTRNGKLGEFKRGFELVLKDKTLQNVKVLPFYIDGIFGSIFSYSKRDKITKLKRDITISFGMPLTSNVNTQEVKDAVRDLKNT